MERNGDFSNRREQKRHVAAENKILIHTQEDQQIRSTIRDLSLKGIGINLPADCELRRLQDVILELDKDLRLKAEVVRVDHLNQWIVGAQFDYSEQLSQDRKKKLFFFIESAKKQAVLH